jgi:hypothetical protein
VVPERLVLRLVVEQEVVPHIRQRVAQALQMVVQAVTAIGMDMELHATIWEELEIPAEQDGLAMIVVALEVLLLSLY